MKTEMEQVGIETEKTSKWAYVFIGILGIYVLADMGRQIYDHQVYGYYLSVPNLLSSLTKYLMVIFIFAFRNKMNKKKWKIVGFVFGIGVMMFLVSLFFGREFRQWMRFVMVALPFFSIPILAHLSIGDEVAKTK